MKTHSQVALDALLWEVSATPKPGLVDRNNSGAHSDMDIFTFIDSAYALSPHFEIFVSEGESSVDLVELFARLRLLGAAAEEDMLRATNGVNTHRGAVFALGLLCGASGFLHTRGQMLSAENLCGTVGKMCERLCCNELENAPAASRGQQMFKKYGVGGARGEAESGFASVLQFGLPVYRRNLCLGQNTALVRALMSLMANVFDTNILGRHDLKLAKWVMEQAQALQGASIADIEAFDRLLIEKNISPGGSADLLAVTYFLHNISL